MCVGGRGYGHGALLASHNFINSRLGSGCRCKFFFVLLFMFKLLKSFKQLCVPLDLAIEANSVP